MDRRTFLAFVATPAVVSALAALQACASSRKAVTDSSTPNSESATGAGVARSVQHRSATTLDDANAATASVNDFGVDLYKALTAKSATLQNLVFSPASIALALDMTRVGAKGTTATEMDSVLHVTDSAGLPHSANALSAALESRTRRIERPQADPVDVSLNIANSLWGQTGFAFETPFLNTLATEFGAGLQLVDYEKDPESARKLINAWVNTNTQQRIPELIPQGPITVDTRLTLVNAIYMKAPWLNVFAKDATRPAPFTTIGGSVVQAPMMHLTEDLGFATGSGWQAVELPYMGEDLSMLIVLPDAGTALVDAVAALALVSGVATTRKVKLSLPKFDIETATELAPVLAAMGMPSAFSDAADFSGMTTALKLTIAAVIHQANITVDEDGTEAAAATAVVMRATAAPEPQEPVELVVNRPFVFAIRDNPTGAVLFVGHIDDPTATRK